MFQLFSLNYYFIPFSTFYLYHWCVFQPDVCLPPSPGSQNELAAYLCRGISQSLLVTIPSALKFGRPCSILLHLVARRGSGCTCKLVARDNFLELKVPSWHRSQRMFHVTIGRCFSFQLSLRTTRDSPTYK